MAENLTGVVESSEAERLATGFGFTEGPLWHPEGYLLFVDIPNSLIYRLIPGGEPEVVRENSGGSNGLTLDAQGRLVMCEGDNRRVTRQESDGSYVTIADRWQGNRLNRPNDVVGSSNGTLYFTDPGGRVPPQDRELDFAGVFLVDASDRLSVATNECEYPNGLAFSPDEKVMYVSITRRDPDCIAEKDRGEVCRHQLIRAFDVQADGSLTNNRVFGDMSSAEDGVPDGMKVDQEGRVYCTGAEGCWVFEANGNLLGIIRLPEVPANCAWGGPDGRTTFFTARTSVYSMRMKVPGASLPEAA